MYVENDKESTAENNNKDFTSEVEESDISDGNQSDVSDSLLDKVPVVDKKQIRFLNQGRTDQRKEAFPQRGRGRGLSKDDEGKVEEEKKTPRAGDSDVETHKIQLEKTQLQKVLKDVERKKFAESYLDQKTVMDLTNQFEDMENYADSARVLSMNKVNHRKVRECAVQQKTGAADDQSKRQSKPEAEWQY
ncbi:hypothetical protein NDU88_008499 [Pleurodeles waltl]|uniref:Uncharacterized protein n=1 Tax=Pleurodeles waltl TaxID=8319 RepID=A0AAV7NY53_PLEWA|nr:hypothetical protein NDU88_008499 [Pleurodeles waltl]